MKVVSSIYLIYRLLSILFTNDIENLSISPHRILLTLLHLWSIVCNTILTAPHDLNPHTSINLTDTSESKQFFIGNKLALTGRSVQNI